MTEEGSYPPDHLKPSSKIGAPTPVGRVRPVLTVVPGAADADDPRRPDWRGVDRRARPRGRPADAGRGVAGRGRRLHRPPRRRARRRRAAAGGAQWHPPAPRGPTSAGAVEVVAPRVNDRRTDPRPANVPVLLGDPAAVGRKTPKITEVLPLLYLHGLSSGDFVPALGQFLGSSAGLSAPVITKLTETWKGEQRSFADRDLCERGLRLPVGRRHPRQHPPRGAQAVPAGADRGARRRPQGARRPGRWLPRVDRVLGGPAARCRPPRDARPGPRDRRRRAGVLGRTTRGVPHHPGAALLVPQDRQRARCAPEIGAPGGEEGPGRDLEHRRQAARPRCRGLVHGGLRGEVSQGRREDHRRSRRVARLLRLPRRALDPPADHERDRYLEPLSGRPGRR